MLRRTIPEIVLMLLLISMLTFAFNVRIKHVNADISERIVFVTEGNIHIINPDGSNEIRLTKGSYPKWSPDGKKIAYKLGSDLYVINDDGTGKIRVAYNVSGDEFSWSPNGEKIVFAGRREWSGNGGLWMGKNAGIYIVNADGSNLVRLTYDEDSAPVFSPDGKKIAYFGCRALENEEGWVRDLICIMNTDGTNKIMFEAGINLHTVGRDIIDWSVNGKLVIGNSGSGDILVMDVNGTNRVLISTYSANPIWSPDGKKIAYVSWPQHSIFVANPDGTGKTQVIEKFTEKISWSPNGEKIIFEDSSEKAIYIVNIDGSGLTKLTYGSYPSWIPEFPSIVILPVFMSITLIATVLLKRKRRPKPQPLS